MKFFLTTYFLGFIVTFFVFLMRSGPADEEYSERLLGCFVIGLFWPVKLGSFIRTWQRVKRIDVPTIDATQPARLDRELAEKPRSF